RMADGSPFLVRWELVNPWTRLAPGRAESEVYNVDQFNWSFSLEKWKRKPTGQFAIHCFVDQNGPWEFDAEVKVSLPRVYGKEWEYGMAYLHFSNEKTKCVLDHRVHWGDLSNTTAFNINNKLTVKYRIRVTNWEGGRIIAEPGRFAVPNHLSNVILKIGYERLHVSKELLAIHSPVFSTMFFGNFAESRKNEIEIKDVVYEEFLGLLNLIYPRTVEITDGTVPHILKLADRFQMEKLMNESEKYLTQSTGFKVMKKLMFADQYRLASLKDHCINSFYSAGGVFEHLKSPEYVNLSADMKASICDRMAKLSME
ncbi:hypothetical protein PMAYCL1PPCAC_24767, partial [Pristionchus mayeri]